MTMSNNYCRRHREKSVFLTLRFWFILIGVWLLLTGGIFAEQKLWSLSQNPKRFLIKTVVIDGQLSHISATQIQKLVQQNLTGNFFTLHTVLARNAVLILPWIQSISFRREWPSTLLVHVEEQTPIARWGENGLMNYRGQIFYPDTKTIPDSLPIFSGPTDQSQNMMYFYQTINMLSQLINLSVIQLNLSNRLSWSLEFNNKISVILGRDDALNRFKKFVAIYPKLIETRKQPVNTVDLRYPNGFAVS